MHFSYYTCIWLTTDGDIVHISPNRNNGPPGPEKPIIYWMLWQNTWVWYANNTHITQCSKIVGDWQTLNTFNQKAITQCWYRPQLPILQDFPGPLIGHFPGLLRTSYVVLFLKYSNNQRVPINKEPAQCCRHIVSNPTMHNLK